jgi:hypothetical protein
VREEQPLNILAIVVTFDVSNNGTFVSDLQLKNIPSGPKAPPIRVTFTVLNNGTVVREVQLTNIPVISVTILVSNNGTLVREEQKLNMFTIVVTAAVLNNDTLIRLEQPLNALVILVTLVVPLRDIFFNEVKLANELVKSVNNPILTPVKLTKFLQKTEATVALPRVKPVKLGQDKTISNIGDESGNIDPACAYFWLKFTLVIF